MFFEFNTKQVHYRGNPRTQFQIKIPYNATDTVRTMLEL